MWVPKMARPDFPDCKFRFFPRWSLWSAGGGGGNPPPTVYGHSNTSLRPALLGLCACAGGATAHKAQPMCTVLSFATPVSVAVCGAASHTRSNGQGCPPTTVNHSSTSVGNCPTTGGCALTAVCYFVTARRNSPIPASRLVPTAVCDFVTALGTSHCGQSLSDHCRYCLAASHQASHPSGNRPLLPTTPHTCRIPADV